VASVPVVEAEVGVEVATTSYIVSMEEMVVGMVS